IGIEDLNLAGLLKNRRLARSFCDAALGKLLAQLTNKVEQRGGRVIKVDRFFPSSKTCHSCGWTWENMELSDRIFLCQNPHCVYHQFPQDRDHNAAFCILREALRLIGLIDQVVTDIGSGDDVNEGLRLDVRPKRPSGLVAVGSEAATTKFCASVFLHTLAHENRSRIGQVAY
ncbi:MAG TPA: transposase, partial [Ktedonobacteraceae bacterium]|nr:transposase [Ktedonobacteraceae bacterium]